MAPPQYIFQRRGGPLVQWDHPSGRPPEQTRGADASGMGSLGATDVFDRPRSLPRGGAPEYLADGMGCSDGCGGKGNGMAGLQDDIVGVATGPIARTVGGIAATYHGYKRTGSIGWALLWGILGSSFPLVAVPLAVAQGFGHRKSAGFKSNPARFAKGTKRRRKRRKPPNKRPRVGGKKWRAEASPSRVRRLDRRRRKRRAPPYRAKGFV